MKRQIKLPGLKRGLKRAARRAARRRGRQKFVQSIRLGEVANARERIALGALETAEVIKATAGAMIESGALTPSAA
ncbi:MAG: hypothetical protein HYT46_00985 [Candidatus Vogelbacteria bacterium]|nr:hypothetical protein [Candidatus Vogelbacteria bacterium]